MRGRSLRIASLVESIAGRTVVILAFGIVLAVATSLLVTEQARLRELGQIRRVNLVARIAETVTALRSQPNIASQRLSEGRVPGLRLAPNAWPQGDPDPEAAWLLSSRIGAAANAEVVRIRGASCRTGPDAGQNHETATPLDCWYVRIWIRPGERHVLVADLPLIRVYQSIYLDPLYLLMLAGIGVLLAVLVTRSTITPLRRLTQAARQFSASTDPTDIPEGGPREVRTALATFNLMQKRVRDGVRERTHILAAVSHDLQTPLTRMRLRLEQVDDEALRLRLIADLGEMQRLVAEGLDLAQSTESREPWSVVDLDSVLSSLAEDMAEVGSPVRFSSGCGGRVRVRLAALTRALQNLIENAVRYGGTADVASAVMGGCVAITVRDQGPGIVEAELETAFEPFRRLTAGSTEGRRGTGLGLTIARAQAATFGGSVTLVNLPGGGLEATIRIPT